MAEKKVWWDLYPFRYNIGVWRRPANHPFDSKDRASRRRAGKNDDRHWRLSRP